VFTPILEAAVEAEEGQINVVRIEIDEPECAELASRYQVPVSNVQANLDNELTYVYCIPKRTSRGRGIKR
jgi:hypothetical protein